MENESFGVVFTKEQDEYFDKIESHCNIKLTEGQKAWYVKKAQTQGEYMKREYPSTPEEAFEAANEGLIFAKQVSLARQEKRICYLPYDEHARTYSVADIGYNDDTAIWIFQLVGKEIHMIDYYENSGESLAHYVKWLKEKSYGYDMHFMPFDANSKEKGTGKSYVDLAREMGLKCQVLPRAKNELFGVEILRSTMSRMFFDERKCAKGIKAVESYRKEWNDKLGCYRERPNHDWSSHGSKALIYCAEACTRLTNGAGMSAEQWKSIRNQYIGY